MSRIAGRFEGLAGARPALVPYIAAGDPSPATTVPLMHELVAAGADLIELGVPFSDPMADGPVIQAACERALARGTDLETVLGLVAEFREHDRDTPVVLMGYMNPIERRGEDAFIDAAAQAGADGVLVVDLPCEEAAGFNRALRSRGLDQIFLIAPTTTERRLRTICALASGFVYYVSLKGITGASNLIAGNIAPALQRIRAQTRLPVGVGFGIKTPADAAEVARSADAVVIGSALVETIAAADDDGAALAAAGAFLRPIREALERSCGERRQRTG